MIMLHFALEDSNDPGISYFELCINFGIIAQQLFPIPVDSKVRHVTYVEYSSDSALLLPPMAAANGQVVVLEKLIIGSCQNSKKVDLIPQYPQHKKACKLVLPH